MTLAPVAVMIYGAAGARCCPCEGGSPPPILEARRWRGASSLYSAVVPPSGYPCKAYCSLTH